MNIFVDISAYSTLLAIAVISGTFLPGPSDPALLGMVSLGYAPVLVITVATIGIIIARIINYAIGTYGEEYVVQKKRWLKQKQVERSKQLFHKYGTSILLFTWIPFIDDPLTIVAGFMRYPFVRYMLYTSIAAVMRHIGLFALYEIFI